MKRVSPVLILILGVALSVGAAHGKRAFSDDIWFLADFDGPTVIGGFAFPQVPSAEGFRDGRFGRGYYFHRASRNILPPMADFMSTTTNFSVSSGATLRTDGNALAFSGGRFSLRAVKTGITCGYLGATGLTCSFYARGRRGGRVSLRAMLSPVDAAVEDRARKDRLWGFPENRIADAFETRDHELSGGWDRLWCVAVGDNRVADGRFVTLTVDSDCPIEMKKFQYEPTGAYPTLRFHHPGVWCDGGTSLPSNPLVCRDAELLKGFPAKEGTFACWIRTETCDTFLSRPPALWGIDSPSGVSWGCNGDYLRTSSDNAAGLTHFGCRHVRSEGWRHVAMTWRDCETAVYVDAVKIAQGSGKHFQDVGRQPRSLRIGAYGEASIADAVLDEMVVFRHAMSPADISMLASSRHGLRTKNRLLATSPMFLTFHRNQRDAAVRCVVIAASTGEYVVTASVGGVSTPRRTVCLLAGRNNFVQPFDPSLLDVGRHTYAVRFENASGRVELELSGSLEVRGRMERGDWKYMSWGGARPCSLSFLRECGFNLVNLGISRPDAPAEVRRIVDAGFCVNLRYENSRDWLECDFDAGKIAEKTAVALSPYSGLHAWTSTLINSEVYGASTAHDAMRHLGFVAYARKALGVEPSWRFGTAPAQLEFADRNGNGAGVAPFRGVFDMSANRDLMTLSWFMDRGSPVFRVNRVTAGAVRRLSSGNCVWTEPIVGQGGIVEGMDMMADWLYSYGTRTLLFEQREQYGRMRGARSETPYAPTLAFSAFMNGLNPEKTGENGAARGPRLCHSADEMAIRSWISLGATRHDALSIFSADSWEQALSNGTIEASWPRQNGDFIRGPYMPAALLLRGIENVRAPYAVMIPSEVQYAANVGWAPYHYGRMILSVLAERPVPFDVVTDCELRADVLRLYSHVLFPLSWCLTREHAAALSVASESGTVVVCDAPGAWLGEKCRNFTHLEGMSYAGISERAKAAVSRELLKWYSGVESGLSCRLGAFSDRDCTDSFTFEKSHDGVRYVLVVNDARSDVRCVLNNFKTNAWYRPLAASSRIATTIRAGRGAWVCQYASDGCRAIVEKSDSGFVARGEYAPASAKVFAIYPKRLVGMSVSPQVSDVAPGHTLVLCISVSDEAGSAAPGRQIVRLRVEDSGGRMRDESGLYAVEGGRTGIPVRIPLSAEPGCWRFRVDELATGFVASGGFSVTAKAACD